MQFSLLVTAFMIAFGGLGAPAAAQTLTSSEAHTLARGRKLLIIDVRPLQDRLRTGVPVGAVEIDKAQPLERFLAAVERVTRRNKHANIALICVVGALSAEAQTDLEVVGYTRVVSIADGMEGSANGPGWLANGLPVRRSRQVPPTKSN